MKNYLSILLVALAAFGGVAAHAQGPVNNNFTSATVISGSSGTVNGTNVNATVEAGERTLIDNETFSASVWYTWTAPVTGNVVFNTFGSNVDTVLAAYTGAAVNTLTSLAENDQSVGNQSQITFNATAGITYRITVASWQGTGQGPFPLNWNLVQANFGLTQTYFPVSEDVGLLQLTVSRPSGGPAATVDYAATPYSASAGSDFDVPSGTLSFAAGEISKTISISIIDNSIPENLEVLVVDISNATGGMGITPGASQAYIEIDDNDVPANDNFANAELVAGATGTVSGTSLKATSEGDFEDFVLDTNGLGGYPVVWYRWVAPQNGLVQFSIPFDENFFQRVHMVRGTNYANLSYLSLIGSSNGPTASVPVAAGATYYVAVYSDAETFELNWALTNAGQFTLTGTRYFPFDNNSGLPAEERYITSEGGGNLEVTVTRQFGFTGTVTVAYGTANDLNTGVFEQASEVDDYAVTTGILTFGPGETEKRFLVPIISDTDEEQTEEFLVVLSAPTGGALLGGQSTARVMILDDENDPENDDFANAADLFGPAGNRAGTNVNADIESSEPYLNNSANATIWYRWAPPLGGAGRISAIFSDNSPNPGNAPHFEVFEQTQLGFLNTLANNETFNSEFGEYVYSSEVTFTAEQGKTYFIRLDSPPNLGTGEINLGWSIATGGIVRFGSSPYRVKEGSGSLLTVPIIREGNNLGAASVRFSAQAGGDGFFNQSEEGLDFTPQTITVTFGAGEMTKNVEVEILDDSDNEGIEEFRLMLRNANGAFLPSTDFDTGAPWDVRNALIDDDDDDPANNALATPTTLTGNNGNRVSANYGADRQAGEPAHGDFSVWYKWTPTQAGLATLSFSSADGLLPTISVYSGPASNPTFANLTPVISGANSVRFIRQAGTTYYIAVTDNGVNDPINGFFRYEFDFTLVYSITQNATVFQFASDAAAVDETAGTATLTVTRTGATTQAASIGYNVYSNFDIREAVDPDDFDGQGGILQTLTFLANQTSATITIPIVNDSVAEGDEVFFVSLDATAPPLFTGTPSFATVTILDDDDNPVPPSNDDLANASALTGASGVAPGNNDNATVEAGEPSPDGEDPALRSVWFKWTAPATGTAVFSIDTNSFPVRTALYSSSSPNSPAFGTLTLVSDALNYGFITVSAVSGTTYFLSVDTEQFAEIYTGNFTLTYRLVQGGLLSVDSVTGNEAGSAEITVTRSNGSAGAASVRLRTVSGGSATSGTDFTPLDTVLNFAAGETSNTVTIALPDDLVVEGEETVALELSEATGDVLISGGFATVTINDDDDDPANDDFAQAVAISGPFGTTSGSNSGAGPQVGEPLNGMGRTVWYRWTAPNNGSATFSATAAYPPSLTVFTGSAVGSLTEVDNASGSGDPVTFTTLAGQVFQIAVDSATFDDDGAFSLTWTTVAPGSVATAVGSISVVENATTLQISVVRSGGSDGSIAVPFTVIPGTASAGSDFTATSGSVVFAAGATTATIPVTINEDAAYEAAESFTVTLGTPTGGAALGAQTATVVTITNDDAFIPVATNVTALVNPSGPHAQTGAITVTTTVLGSFSGKLIFGGVTYKFKAGQFDAFGHAILSLSRKGAPTLSIEVQAGANGVAGNVYDGVISAAFSGERAGYSKIVNYTQPSPFTALLERTETAAGKPAGTGFATLTVGVDGSVKVKGMLADGAKVTASGFLTVTNRCVLFIPLYKGAGELAGEFVLRDIPSQSHADGTFAWFKPAGLLKEKFYAGGFTTQSRFIASRFVPAPSGTRVLPSFTSGGTATISGGGLSSPLTTTVALGLDNKVSVTPAGDKGLTLVPTAKTGACSGGFVPAVGQKAIKGKGVVFQAASRMVVLFFGATESGTINAQP